MAINVEILLETNKANRHLDEKFDVEYFGTLHLPCNAVILENLPTVNSAQTDPATGDLKPLFRYKLTCTKDHVSSLPEETVGQ